MSRVSMADAEMGRRPKDIDAEMVRKLAKIGSTQEDIAEFFDCSQSVISERFRSDFQLGSAESKISLRRMQWKAARAGFGPDADSLGQSSPWPVRSTEGYEQRVAGRVLR